MNQLLQLASLYGVDTDRLLYVNTATELAFQASYSDSEYRSIRQGYAVHRMEDKWDIYLEGNVATSIAAGQEIVFTR